MADTVTTQFAGSTIVADILSTGDIGVTITLPSGGTFSFVDTGDGIPQSVLDYALTMFPDDTDAITSLLIQWPQLSASIRAQLSAAPVATSYYENDGTVSSSVPTEQKTVNAGQDPGLKPSTYYNPNTNTYPPNPPITDFSAESINISPEPAPSARGLLGAIQAARAYATTQDQAISDTAQDWRVKLSLGSGADYLYKAPTPGILAPLKATNGVIFPYTPQISVVYSSNYDTSDVVHSNYKIFQYKNSSVDSISVTCDFTAQDTYEANYLLAVIHFFRAVTKMFYGQDQNPKNGTPPPLCFLSGLGQYQFNEHPLLISNFTYNLPTDVDYIRADVDASSAADSINESSPAGLARLTGGMKPGGIAEPPKWATPQNKISNPTYVPTKMQISFQAHPLVTRNEISNKFSLREYATGGLLRGGIW